MQRHERHWIVALDDLRRLAHRKRNLGWVAAAAGVGMIAAGWLGDNGNWESVFIEVGAALALVVAILVVEDAWRAGVDERIGQVEREVADVRAVALGVVADAQKRQRQMRLSSDEALIEAWAENPGPGTLWAIALRCDELGCDRPAQTLVGDAVVNVSPISDVEAQLVVVPRSSEVGTGTQRRAWTSDDELLEVIDWTETAMASLGIHPGQDRFQMDAVVRELGELYGQRIASRFANESD